MSSTLSDDVTFELPPTPEEPVDESSSSEEHVVKMQKILEAINTQAKSIGDLIQDLTGTVESADTGEGLSFLALKNQLMMDYLLNLLNVICSKCSGESIVDSPAVHKLVEVRTVLEKIRPTDQKLKYQIEKLVRAAVDGKSDSDSLQFKANPDDLDRSDESDNDSDMEEKPKVKPEVYRPPKVAPQHFDDDQHEAQAKSVEKVKRKTINRALIREMQEEFLDTPVEVHNMGDAYAKQLSREVRDRERYEETYMTRLPVTKQEKHKQGKLSTLGQLGDELTNFSSRKRSGAAGGGGGKKKKAGKGGKKKFRK